MWCRKLEAAFLLADFATCTECMAKRRFTFWVESKPNKKGKIVCHEDSSGSFECAFWRA